MSPPSGWRFPTPHELVTVLFLIAEAARQANVFQPGTFGYHTVGFVCTLAGLAGIALARAYISPRVQQKLQVYDAVTSGADGNDLTGMARRLEGNVIVLQDVIEAFKRQSTQKSEGEK